MDLKTVSTDALVKELESRENVKKIAVGPYQDYRLETKYKPDGAKEIVSDTVLVFTSRAPHSNNSKHFQK